MALRDHLTGAMKVLHVVGARPNFMKVAPVLAELRKEGRVRQVLVHTGQHYDPKMSDVFFQDLGMPAPDAHLGAGGGTHAQQTARIMVEVEPVIEREKPDVLVVSGDVNSTVAVALVAVKLGVPVAHIEAGFAHLGLVDARGGEPRPHRPHRRAALHTLSGRGRTPRCGRGRKEPAGSSWPSRSVIWTSSP